MKNKALYILLVIVFFVVSCKTDKQQVANKNIERYIKSKVDNPNSFELVSIKKLEKDRYFTSLDSIAPINDLFDYKQYEVYADTADRDRPWVRASNLNDLSDVKYDMLVFFNSSAIDSLYTNFPKFTQDETRLAIFGNNTAETVIGHKLNVNIFAPTPENPSLVDAIKKYIKTANKR